MSAERSALLLIAHLAAPKPDGPSLSDLARLTGCSRATASKCANGLRAPSLKMRMAAELLWKRPWQELFAPVSEPATQGCDAPDCKCADRIDHLEQLLADLAAAVTSSAAVAEQVCAELA